MPYWRLFYHLIWGTKQRVPVIGDQEEEFLRRSFARTCQDLAVIPHAVGIMPEHVHVVISAPPKLAPAEVVKRLKGASAHAINEVKGRDRHPEASFAWQAEYGGLSFGDKALPAMVNYVTHQREHHATGNLWPTAECDRPPSSKTSPTSPSSPSSSRLKPTE
jgi:putative transposase